MIILSSELTNTPLPINAKTDVVNQIHTTQLSRFS
jgi:hypothetical protein